MAFQLLCVATANVMSTCISASALAFRSGSASLGACRGSSSSAFRSLPMSTCRFTSKSASRLHIGLPMALHMGVVQPLYVCMPLSLGLGLHSRSISRSIPSLLLELVRPLHVLV